jgi:hypothetical protein
VFLIVNWKNESNKLVKMVLRITEKQKILLVIVLILTILILNDIRIKHNEKQLIDYKITTAKITKISKGGVHQPSHFEYSYLINGNQKEGRSNGKISPKLIYKKIKIKYAKKDHSLSEVINLDSLIAIH